MSLDSRRRPWPADGRTRTLAQQLAAAAAAPIPPPRRRGQAGAAARAAARRLAEALAALIPPPPGLSRREAELLPWLATDLSYQAISDELGYSLHNAKLLAARLMRRLGVATRQGAVARWLRPAASPPNLAGRPD